MNGQPPPPPLAPLWLRPCMWEQIVFTSKKALKKKIFHPENAGNGICETLHFKIFPGSMSPDPYDSVRRSSGRRTHGRPSPPPQNKNLDLYAYDLAWYDKNWQGKFTKHPPSKQMVVSPLTVKRIMHVNMYIKFQNYVCTYRQAGSLNLVNPILHRKKFCSHYMVNDHKTSHI